jgi:hypothetical protein
MSSSYKGFWINGTHSAGFTAKNGDGQITDIHTGKVVALHLAGIKRAIEEHVNLKVDSKIVAVPRRQRNHLALQYIHRNKH